MVKIDYGRSAHVRWEGDLEGRGTLTTESGALGEQPVSFYARLNHPKRRQQTTPEELLAAAMATDFAMVLAVVLAEAGHPPGKVDVDSTCSWERLDEGGYRLSSMSMDVRARVPGIDSQELVGLVNQASEISPFSMALRGNVELNVASTLDSE